MFDIDDEEMKDVWTIPAVQISKKKLDYNGTQKTNSLLERIINDCSKVGDIVLAH